MLTRVRVVILALIAAVILYVAANRDEDGPWALALVVILGVLLAVTFSWDDPPNGGGGYGGGGYGGGGDGGLGGDGGDGGD
ncbi:hypothetical protein [Streptosporangium pseudovulgare]|uniref:Uncharacterized protein n=1 Tax=Streptosporangium pseudovulgare TaxID=35765 RepID=A0ABQ2QY79_9ACTN|nr:hypothetical protein [Streptosporangium pseudovulgare]GGQ00288.1 hypothetical protein GCM10010140_32950 [Streptosporangium pseudovulgare]